MERDQAEFNYSISYLQVLRNLENQCITARLGNNYPLWLRCIEAMESELHRIMKPSEREISRRLIQEASLGLAKWSLNNEEIVYNPKMALTKAEQYLKNIIQESGAGMKFKRDPGRTLYEDSGF